MLIGLISDLHANLEATEAVFKELDKMGPDVVLSLGDLTGYGANPNEVVDIIRKREVPTVMGNHDMAVCGREDPWFFNNAAKRAVEWQSQRLREDNKQWLAAAPEQIKFNGCCLGVHGAPSNRDDYIIDWLDAVRQLEFLNGSGIKMCFFGHSHKQGLFSETDSDDPIDGTTIHQLHEKNRYFINPGAVGQPRDHDSRAAFGLFDMEKKTFEFRRVEYDIRTCQRKIGEAGLPIELAIRLSKGR